MRIAQVTPRGVHPYSGLLASLVQLSIALAKRGLEVEVWQLHGWPEENRGFTEALEENGVELVTVDAGTSPRRLSAEAVRQIGRRRVDGAHLHGVFNPTNNLLAKRLDVPYVVSPHGGYAAESLDFHRFRKVAFKYLFELPMLRRAAAMIALSQQESGEVQRFGYRDRVAVIPNGAVPAPKDLDESAFRTELGLDGTTRLAVYAGRIDISAKRLDRVVRAVAGNERWHLALLGGDFRHGIGDVTALAAKLGAADRVHLPGPRRGRALYEALRAADAFVLISRSEGMPMALLEALAAGTPAVVSAEVDRAIGVSSAGAGWVTEPDGLSSLLDRLGNLSSEEWGLRRSAAVAVASQYDWSNVAGAYEDLYQQVFA
ncbi:MAG: glycosyltransferase [Acidimicrobiia bacterium]|nr:glycosyltransferase [Acidimicrobiia bacterium]MDH3471636.1 glycosyltransferase [Acidimicrobiia bacterium]